MNTSSSAQPLSAIPSLGLSSSAPPSVYPSASSSIGLGAAPVSSAASSAASATASATAEAAGGEASFLRSPIFIGVIVVIALALVGFNVFSYLGAGTDFVSDGIMPTIERVTGSVSEFVNKFTDNTTLGTKGAVDVAGGTVKAGASIPHKIVTKGAAVPSQTKKKIDATSVPAAESFPATDNDNATATATASAGTSASAGTTAVEPSAASGPGFCYIGEDQGHRSCISVNESTKCMSGDVFQTHEKCIAPR